MVPPQGGGGGGFKPQARIPPGLFLEGLLGDAVKPRVADIMAVLVCLSLFRICGCVYVYGCLCVSVLVCYCVISVFECL